MAKAVFLDFEKDLGEIYKRWKSSKIRNWKQV